MDNMAGTSDLPGNSDVAKRRRSFGTPRLAFVLGVVVVGLLILDFSEVLFVGRTRRIALEMVQPGMRLTEIERTLNSAGYSTLYVEGVLEGPVLQVSTLSELPWTMSLLDGVMRQIDNSGSGLDGMIARTRFYIVSDPEGVVRFDGTGRPVTRGGSFLDI